MYHGGNLWADVTETTTDHVLRQAKHHENQYSDHDEDHPAAGPAEMYRWREVRDFPVAKLAWEHTPEQWAKWLEDEHSNYDGEGESSPWTGLLGTKQITDPITVVIGQDGKYYLWDGNHRVAAAFKNKIATVPAYVGTPKQQPQGQRLTYTNLGAAHAQR